MMKPVPPMSGAQRLRRYRLSHPDYDRKYKARCRAMAKRVQEELAAERRAEAAAAGAAPIAAGSVSTHATPPMPAPTDPLAA
jgi:hypothetical protein